ncbi:MAG: hypothetical protein WC738_06755 [Candidatus Omnitrophota bacterium]|jgi:hypothetical protein
MIKEHLKIKNFIKQVRSEWIAAQVTSAIYRFAFIFLSSILIIFIADNIFNFPVFLLTVFSLIIPVLAIAFILLNGIKIARIGSSDDYFAVFLEKNVPDLKNKVINALQIGRSFSASDGTSEAFVKAIVADALRSIGNAKLTHSIFEKKTGYYRLRSAITLAFLFLYAALLTPYFYNALERYTSPFKHVEHYRNRFLTVMPGDKTVNKNSDMKISALPERIDKARNCIIRYKTASGSWNSTVMVPAKIGFRHIFKNLEEDITYRIEYGIYRSRNYKMEIKEGPKISKIKLILKYPMYTKIQPRTIDGLSGEIAALTGTEADVSVWATAKIAQAKVLVNETQIPVSVNEDNLNFKFTVEKSGYYKLDISYEGSDVSKTSAVYNITALEDSVPEVIIKKPGRDISVGPQDKAVTILIEARDDFGIKKTVLMGKASDKSKADIIKEWDMKESDKRSFSELFDVDLKKLDLKDGSIYKYWAETYDANTMKTHGFGKSQEYAIKFISKDKAREAMIKYITDFMSGLEEIIKMQAANRNGLTSGKSIETCLEAELKIKDKTLLLVKMLKEGVLPIDAMVSELESVANADMGKVINTLSKIKEKPQDTAPIINEAVPVMDEIIKKLENLLKGVEKLKELEEKGVLEDLLNKKELYEKLNEFRNTLLEFIQDQEQAIKDSKELPKKYFKDYTDGEKKKIEEVEKIEMKSQKTFTDSVDDIEKLTKLGFSSGTLVSDTRQILVDVEKVTEFFRSKEGIIFFIPVELMEGTLALARQILENVEFGLQSRKDWRKWILEDIPQGILPDIPIVELPDTLYDIIGDLIEDQDDFNDEMDDLTSMWADSIPNNSGYDTHDGPISNFSAIGVTANILPDNQELTGRSGDGRAGRSSGELVEPVAKGLDGRNIPTRLTNDPYEKGVVQEMRKQYVGGQTGGGKTSGTTGLGLEGDLPPQTAEINERLQKGEEDIREKAERVRDKMEVIMVKSDSLNTAIKLMKDAEKDIKDYKYKDVAKKNQWIIKNLDNARQDIVRSFAVSKEPSSAQKESRKDILNSPQESYPENYKEAVAKYYKSLSDSEK